MLSLDVLILIIMSIMDLPDLVLIGIGLYESNISQDTIPNVDDDSLIVIIIGCFNKLATNAIPNNDS